MLHIFYLRNKFDTFLGILHQNQWTAYDQWGYSRVDLSYIAKSMLVLNFSPEHEILFQQWDNRNLAIDKFGDLEISVNDETMFKQLIRGII